MRLISCYIENYGALSGASYSFTDGINEQMLENGAGKTTLAAFLQAMLYGMESYRKNSKGFCDRQRYYPFTGGVYGGSLTFEHEGKVYKIERTFGEQSDTTDTLTVYIDGVRTVELGDDIGKAVLGLDKESFRKTAFIGSDEIEISSTSGISAKLNGFLQGIDEDTDFDEAKDGLEKAAKVYDKRGSGLIAETNDKIAVLRRAIANGESTVAALALKYDEEKELSAEIFALAERVKEAQLRNERLGEWEYYERLQAQVEEAEQEKKAIEALYPFGLPSEADTESIRQVEDELVKGKAQFEKKVFSVVDEARLEEHKRRFFNGEPSETELAGIERNIEELSKLETETAFYGEVTLTEENGRLLQKFGRAYPTDEELVQGERTAKACVAAKNELASIPPTVSVTERVAKEQTKSKKYGALAVLAVVLMAVGLGLLFVNTLVGVVAAAVGAVLLIADGFLYLNQKSSVGFVENTVEQRNPKRDEKEGEIRGLEDSVRALVLPYGYTLEDGEVMAVYRLREDLKKYLAYLETTSERERVLKEKQAEIAKYKEKLEVFFAGYKITADKPRRAISDLRAILEEYKDLQTRKENAVKGEALLYAELEKCKGQVREYLQKYGLEELDLRKIEKDFSLYKSVKERLEKSVLEADGYRKEKRLEEKPSGEKEDIAMLSESLQELRRKEAALARDIKEDEYAVEKLDEACAECETLQERLKEYKEKSLLLTKAKEFLLEADKRLKDKYIKPIRDEFTAFAKPLERAVGEKVVMTKNFEIRYDLHGKEREGKHLSAGQRSICALCFRLALIKNMYADGLPFLILDDPFVHLDEEHMSRVKELLKELSKDFQMIYFTCHESRKVLD